ncbi:unnamed protein product [Cochlearia groenlandica]
MLPSEQEKITEEEQVTSLKDLIPFNYPTRTQTTTFEHMPKLSKPRYVKVKETLVDSETSKRVYWREDQTDHHDHVHGCLCVLKRNIRRIIDKWFGSLFGLRTFDEFSYCVCVS